jgi:hypothetical protein
MALAGTRADGEQNMRRAVLSFRLRLLCLLGQRVFSPSFCFEFLLGKENKNMVSKLVLIFYGCIGVKFCMCYMKCLNINYYDY